MNEDHGYTDDPASGPYLAGGSGGDPHRYENPPLGPFGRGVDRRRDYRDWFLAASLHLAASLKNSSVMELDCTHNPLRSELLREPLEAENGFMVPPHRPGLGIDLDPKAVKRFAFSGVEEISLRQKAISSI